MNHACGVLGVGWTSGGAWVGGAGFLGWFANLVALRLVRAGLRQLWLGGVGFAEAGTGSGSFLKKRTKKLLVLGLGRVGVWGVLEWGTRIVGWGGRAGVGDGCFGGSLVRAGASACWWGDLSPGRHQRGCVLGAVKAAARRCAVAPQSSGASPDRTCARSLLLFVAGMKKRLLNRTKKRWLAGQTLSGWATGLGLIVGAGLGRCS